MAAENNLLGKYGAQSDYGAEIPITVLGIVMKINQILNSIIIGIAAGSQPIIGYNYGAKKYDRVRKTLKIVLGSSLVISTIAFILFQTIPDKLILIFGNGDAKYMEFACLAFRTYLLLCILQWCSNSIRNILPGNRKKHKKCNIITFKTNCYIDSCYDNIKWNLWNNGCIKCRTCC